MILDIHCLTNLIEKLKIKASIPRETMISQILNIDRQFERI